MRWTPQQKIRVGFWILPILPVILCILFAANAVELIDSSTEIAHTSKVLRTLLSLNSRLKEIEVEQREYLITGQPTSLERYDVQRKKTLEELNVLKELCAPDKRRNNYAMLLEDNIHQKFEEMQKTIEVRSQQGLEAASRQVLSDPTDKPMASIETLIQSMLKTETEMHRTGEQDQKHDFTRTVALFVSVLLLNILLVVGLRFLMNREAQEARREEERIRLLNIELEEKVAHRTEALRKSNEDLQQFAYVASHDLQEPLRMVGSYIGLLQRRYEGKLDKDADDFINFAVDGVKRMSRLIQDLLEYSRAGENKTERLTDLNMEKILDTVLQNLEVKIRETGATVTHDPLPNVFFDSMRLMQILQNLIANAIKYRSERPPEIHISSRTNGRETVLLIRDNGMGIDPKFHQQIFGVFQRLHGREYEGSGIGLAMVKKIVERYGGRIWVESKPGEGATFCFTILNRKAQLAQAS